MTARHIFVLLVAIFLVGAVVLGHETKGRPRSGCKCRLLPACDCGEGADCRCIEVRP